MIPRLRFAHLPTPVDPLPRLSQVLGGPRLLVKRDDQTGLAFGGNKTRKLEFLMAEAQEMGAKTLISAGALQSNHCRQTAAAAARFGMECILVLTGKTEETPSANFMLDTLFGAQIIHVVGRAGRDRVLQETFETDSREGKKPYLVPYGGSSPTGALGYVYAVEEVMQQNVDANWFVFGSSSGGTHAGLTLGQRCFNYPGRCSASASTNRSAVCRSMWLHSLRKPAKKLARGSSWPRRMCWSTRTTARQATAS